MLKRKIIALSILLSAVSGNALAHEYWLEPLQYTIEPGEALQGNLYNGQNFKGSRYSFIENRFDLFKITDPDGEFPVAGRNGDIPALNMPIEAKGLISVSYQGKFDRITFTNEEKIKHYIEYEGFKGVLERNAERGYPPDRLQEQYARCAKALFQVGPVEPNQKDRLTGMKLELVAEANPYALSQADSLPVRLYWEGKPMPDVQIRLFRFDGELETTEIRTDTEGRAAFPLKGGGKFMMNAVHIFEGDDDPDTKLAEWVSYWATLSFGMSDTDEVIEALKRKTE